MAKTTVRLSDGYRTTIQSRDHIYHADEPADAGGSDQAPTPTEMLMGALGSCIAITMKLYAERKGWQLDDVEIALDFERFNAKDYADHVGDASGFVHEFRKHIKLHGDLDEKQRNRILDIGAKCPVHRAISSPAYFVQEILDSEALPE